jgi:hypothetical protein
MLIDIVASAALYTLRVIGGAAAINVMVSEWLLAARASLPSFASQPLWIRYVLFAIIAGVMKSFDARGCLQPCPRGAVSRIDLGRYGGRFRREISPRQTLDFFDGYGDARQEIYKVFLYASFSVAMTLVFWGFEIAFLAIGGTDFAEYLSAVIGLGIGNFAKYFLDRSFTFKQKAPSWK